VVGSGIGAVAAGFGVGAFGVGFGAGAFAAGFGAGAFVDGFGAGSFAVGFGAGSFAVGFGAGAFVVGFGAGSFVIGFDAGVFAAGFVVGFAGVPPFRPLPSRVAPSPSTSFAGASTIGTSAVESRSVGRGSSCSTGSNHVTRPAPLAERRFCATGGFASFSTR
jgi:hypothetical protein